MGTREIYIDFTVRFADGYFYLDFYKKLSLEKINSTFTKKRKFLTQIIIIILLVVCLWLNKSRRRANINFSLLYVRLASFALRPIFFHYPNDAWVQKFILIISKTILYLILADGNKTIVEKKKRKLSNLDHRLGFAMSRLDGVGRCVSIFIFFGAQYHTCLSRWQFLNITLCFIVSTLYTIAHVLDGVYYTHTFEGIHVAAL